MEYILSPTWILIDLLTILTFSGAFLDTRWNPKKSFSIFTIFWILMSGYTFVISNEFVEQLLSIFLTVVLLLALYKGSWPKHILCAIVGIIFIGIIDTILGYGICAILGISYSQLIWKKFLFIIVATGAKLIELLLAYLFKRLFFQGKNGTIQSRWLILTLLFPVSSLLMMIVVFLSFQTRADLSMGAFLFSCVLFVANIATIYLINIMEKRTREEQQLTLLNQQMDVQRKSIVALEKSYQNQRSVTHEHLHQLQTIVDLLDHGEEQAIRQYVAEIQGTRRATALNVNTHNPVLDAILNQKYQWASENGIKVEFQINDLSQISLGLNELVVLFSNLFDNAIEACLKLPSDRAIHCHIIKGESLFVSIRNTSPPVEILNGMIETTKEPKQEHGFGLPNIGHILNGLSAEFAYHFEDGWFHFVAEIPLKSSK